jgi:hypothetical protein
MRFGIARADAVRECLQQLSIVHSLLSWCAAGCSPSVRDMNRPSMPQ